ncbi:MFS transporter [Actinopolymorpha sp. B11F2]|uniref:MFS transporter n=1 Tax=Actinopolymorpha sp. B11F2 TaxID=3160862 RepID=UPI0032E3FF1D
MSPRLHERSGTSECPRPWPSVGRLRDRCPRQWAVSALPQRAPRRRGLPPPLGLQQVGLALSIAAIVRLPATGGAGILTDRIGSKSAVIISNIAQAMGFASYLFVDSFTPMLFAAIGVQVGNSLFWVAYPALVHEVADKDGQERWFALINAMRNAGLAVGALGASVAVALGGTLGYRMIVAVNAASFIVAAVLTRLDPSPGQLPRQRTPDRSPAAGWSAVLHDRPFLGFVCVNLGFVLLSLSFVIAVPVFLVEFADLPGWTPGTLLALNAILGALGAAPVVAAITGRRRDHVLFSSQLIIGVGYGCILLAGLAPMALSLTFALLAAVLVTTTELIQGPAISAIVNESADDQNRGRYIRLPDDLQHRRHHRQGPRRRLTIMRLEDCERSTSDSMS